jgi:hypothetical protein
VFIGVGGGLALWGGLVRVRGGRRDMCEKIVGDEERLGRGWIEEGEGKFEMGELKVKV